MPFASKRRNAAKAWWKQKKIAWQSSATLKVPPPTMAVETKAEPRQDLELLVEAESSLPLEPTIEIDVKQEPVYTEAEGQLLQEEELEVKEELVDVENPGEFGDQEDPIGQDGSRSLPQSKEENEDDFRCQFCLKLFQESGGRGIITKARIEFVLGLRKWRGTRPNCCEGCRRMFDLFYEFKQSCLVALTQPADLFVWSLNKGPAQFVELKPSIQKKPKPRRRKTAQIKESKGKKFLEFEDFPGLVVNAKQEYREPEAVIPVALPAELQQGVEGTYIEPEPVSAEALPAEMEQEGDEVACIICNAKFSDGLALKKHLTKHYTSVPPKKRERKRRAPVDKEKKTYCGRCRKWFTDKAVYLQHKPPCIENHKLNKPPPPEFACTLCPKKFIRQQDLAYHTDMHNDVRTIPCRREGCTKMFYNPNVRKNHENLCGQDIQVICSMCGSIFRSKSALRIHMSTHGDPQFMCTLCNKGFYTKANLKKHASAHSDERRFQCKTCGKRFKSHEANRVHQRIHTEEKPYVCHICGQRFTYNCLLKTHLEKGHESLPGLLAPNDEVFPPNPFAGLGF